MNPEDLEMLVTREMPFGRYAGRLRGTAVVATTPMRRLVGPPGVEPGTNGL